MAQLTKEYFDQRLGEQTKELKAYTDQQTEALARIVNAGFQRLQGQYLEPKFQELVRHLDVRELVEEHERKFQKLEEQLRVKL